MVCWRTDETVLMEPHPGERFTALGYRAGFACGLTGDGAALCWHDDGRRAPAPDGPFRSITVGTGYACALRDDGTAVCSGQADFENADGQASPPADERFTSISAGGSHTCALREDGRIRCWGSDSAGQASPPVRGRYTSVSAAGGHTCALRDNGVVVCWGGTGSRHWKRLGEVSTRSGRFMSVSAGDAQTWAIREDGALVCWGSGAWPCNVWPPLGPSRDGEYYGGEPWTEAARELTERFISIGTTVDNDVGNRNTCAVREDGAGVCWMRGRRAVTAPPAGERFASVAPGWGGELRGAAGRRSCLLASRLNSAERAVAGRTAHVDRLHGRDLVRAHEGRRGPLLGRRWAHRGDSRRAVPVDQRRRGPRLRDPGTARTRVPEVPLHVERTARPCAGGGTSTARPRRLITSVSPRSA